MKTKELNKKFGFIKITVDKVLSEFPDAKDHYGWLYILCLDEEKRLPFKLTPIEKYSLRYLPSTEAYSRHIRDRVQKGEIQRSKKSTKAMKKTEQAYTQKFSKKSSKAIVEPRKTKHVEYVRNSQGYEEAIVTYV